MSVTLDANVLVYASNESDAMHDRARSLVKELATGTRLVHLFWPVLLGYLRIVTHPAVLPRPLDPLSAQANVDQLLARPQIRASGELDGFWRVFRGSSDPPPHGNEVPDAHVVALMRQHGVATIYTRDRDFRRYDGITVHDPFS